MGRKQSPESIEKIREAMAGRVLCLTCHRTTETYGYRGKIKQ